MTIHLPKELESSIEAVVHSGRFAWVNEAMAEAARLLLPVAVCSPCRRSSPPMPPGRLTRFWVPSVPCKRTLNCLMRSLPTPIATA